MLASRAIIVFRGFSLVVSSPKAFGGRSVCCHTPARWRLESVGNWVTVELEVWANPGSCAAPVLDEGRQGAVAVRRQPSQTLAGGVGHAVL